jgi:hypothetical protein
VLESLLATDSVMRVRGGSAGVASWAPFNCKSELMMGSRHESALTRLRLREGVTMESASDCG